MSYAIGRYVGILAGGHQNLDFYMELHLEDGEDHIAIKIGRELLIRLADAAGRTTWSFDELDRLEAGNLEPWMSREFLLQQTPTQERGIEVIKTRILWVFPPKLE